MYKEQLDKRVAVPLTVGVYLQSALQSVRVTMNLDFAENLFEALAQVSQILCT